MSRVRVLVGTQKGAFILSSDGRRDRWDVSGPHFAGWDIVHFKGSPVQPNRLYAAATSVRFGQQIQRSDNGGISWETIEDAFTADGEYARIAHLEPSLFDADLVYAGVDDIALYRSVDGARTWEELPGLRGQASEAAWQPEEGTGLHAILLDPSKPERIYVTIIGAGAYRSDDGGAAWAALENAGGCVHRIALHPSVPDRLYAQGHESVMRSNDAGATWEAVNGTLPSGFGFALAVHATEADTIYVVPMKSDAEQFPVDGKLRVYRSRNAGVKWDPLTTGLPQRDCYVNVMRDALAIDTFEPCGLYFGTTGGQVYASSDAGDSWTPIVRDLPAVNSVEVQTIV